MAHDGHELADELPTGNRNRKQHRFKLRIVIPLVSKIKSCLLPEFSQNGALLRLSMPPQNYIRAVLASQLAKIADENLEEAISEAQAEWIAEKLVSSLGGSIDPLKMRSIIANEGDILRSCYIVPTNINQFISSIVIRDCPDTEIQDNGKTRKELKVILERTSDSIKRRFDALFKSKNNDRFANRRVVLSRLQEKLTKSIYDRAVHSVTPSVNEDIRVLTICFDQGYSSQKRQELLSLYAELGVSRFPYVVKHIDGNGHIFKSDLILTPNKNAIKILEDEVFDVIPEVRPVRECLERFISDKGLISEMLPVDSPLQPAEAEKFDKIPDFFAMAAGEIMLPKERHLQRNRQKAYGMPDGAICLIGLCIVLESFLRQYASVLNIPNIEKYRGLKLIEKVDQALCETIGRMSERCKNMLRFVLGESRGPCLRDSAVHGAFTANDRELLFQNIHIICDALSELVAEIERFGREEFKNSPLWNSLEPLTVEELETINLQYSNNILYQSGLVSLQPKAFDAFRKFLPDKHFLARAIFVFWGKAEDENRNELTGNEAAEFCALIGGLLIFEELLRALQEKCGFRILNVSSVNNTILKCELPFLADNEGQLLEHDRITACFPGFQTDNGFLDSYTVIRKLRDRVFHGGWNLVPVSRTPSIHLIIKLILATTERLMQ